jgi:hypothetical protein
MKKLTKKDFIDKKVKCPLIPEFNTHFNSLADKFILNMYINYLGEKRLNQNKDEEN